MTSPILEEFVGEVVGLKSFKYSIPILPLGKRFKFEDTELELLFSKLENSLEIEPVDRLMSKE